MPAFTKLLLLYSLDKQAFECKNGKYRGFDELARFFKIAVTCY